MKREEAVSVVKELLDCCVGLDGHSLELTPPNTPNAGYQIIIRVALDEKTQTCIQEILTMHQLAFQCGSMWKTKRSISKEPDTFIIYKPKKTASS